MSRTARQALGYRQVLDAPSDVMADELKEPISRATKRFARRQGAWFNADPRVKWFDISDDAPGNVYEYLAGGN
jgi:tRNA dimethylallyltransferase